MRNNYRGKRVLGGSKRTMLTVLTLALVLLLSVGGTLAWLTAQTGSITNTFTLADFKIDVDEEFDNGTKTDVGVTNNSDVPVYIRVALIPTWLDKTTMQPVGTPASLNNLTIDWGAEGDSETADAPGNGWIKIGDYWYYTQPVAAGDTTANLIARATITYTDGSTEIMRLEVMADAIQAEPDRAVESVWPVTVNTDSNGVKTLSAKSGN